MYIHSERQWADEIFGNVCCTNLPKAHCLHDYQLSESLRVDMLLADFTASRCS